MSVGSTKGAAAPGADQLANTIFAGATSGGAAPVFHRGESFIHATFYASVTAEDIDQAKQLMLTGNKDYSTDQYNISFEPGDGHTQMTVIEKNLPKQK